MMLINVPKYVTVIHVIKSSGMCMINRYSDTDLVKNVLFQISRRLNCFSCYFVVDNKC